MNFLYKLLLTINATSWMGIIYAIKRQWTFNGISPHFFGIVLLFLPVLFSFISLIIAKRLSKDNLAKCLEVSLADGEFLPVYLGYFFVSISVSENWTMLRTILLSSKVRIIYILHCRRQTSHNVNYSFDFLLLP